MVPQSTAANRRINNFIESETYANHLRHAFIFFNALQSDSLKQLINNNFDDNWKRDNAEFIENIDTLRYYMNHCSSADTSVLVFDFESISDQEKVIETRVSNKRSCPDNIASNLHVVISVTFSNKENGELVGVKPEFKKFVMDYDKLSFPSVE